MVMSDEIASTQTAFTAMIAVVVCTLVVVDVVSARFSDVRPSDVDEWMRVSARPIYYTTDAEDVLFKTLNFLIFRQEILCQEINFHTYNIE